MEDLAMAGSGPSDDMHMVKIDNFVGLTRVVYDGCQQQVKALRQALVTTHNGKPGE